MSFENINKLRLTNAKLAKKLNMILEEKQLLTKERDSLKIEAIKLNYTVKLNRKKVDDQVKLILDEIEEDIGTVRYKLDGLRAYLGIENSPIGFDNDLSQLNLSQNFKSTPNKSNYSSPRNQLSPSRQPSPRKQLSPIKHASPRNQLPSNKQTSVETVIGSPKIQLSKISEDNKEITLGKGNLMVNSPAKPIKKELDSAKFKEKGGVSPVKRSFRGNRKVDYSLPNLKKKMRRIE